MVLENPSSPTYNTLPNDAPASDDDRYSTSPDDSKTFAIDGSKLPKPMPIIGPMLGFDHKLLGKLMAHRIKQISRSLQRPVTEEETIALTYWTAKNMSIVSYGGPLGIAGGVWRAYRTHNTFRFPFFQPQGEMFNPTAWPAPRSALLSGPRAIAAWHACRVVAYGGLGHFLGKLFGMSYGLSVSAVGEFTDPRLQDYRKDLTQLMQRARGRLPNSARPAGGADDARPKDASAPWKDHRGQMDDDASPASDAYGDTEVRSADIPVIPEKETSEARPAMQDRRRGPITQAPDGADQTNGLDDPQGLLFDAFDEASPRDGRGNGKTDAAVESAWERIRQRGGVRAASQRRTNSERGPSEAASSPGIRTRVRDRYRDDEHDHRGRRGERDGVDDSTTDRDAVRAKAQQDFDAGVEQERRGGDFGQDREKRW